MILAAGLTPAWQQIYVFDRFQPGEVNRATQTAYCASGKVLNVAVALRLLGAESREMSVIGGPTRQAIDQDLDAIGVARRWIETASPVRACTTIIERQTNTTTELVENAGSLTRDELDRFRRAYAEEAATADFVVLTGSLPAGTPTAFYRELLDETPCPALLDIRGPELPAALERKPFLVKPNREELAATVGRPLADDAALHAAMAELNDRGARWVVITQGRGPVWVRGDGKLHRLDPPQLPTVVNPIGCGDALTAGIAAALQQGRDPLAAVEHGLKVAAASALHLLPGRFDPKSI